jgi:hypothetical protein
MIGNDANEGTDRGTEVYYRKIPISYSGKGTFVVGDVNGNENIALYDESTPTWTGYDDGAVEATLNLTVGSGATVTSSDLKIAAGSAACLGNKEFSRPVGVCFNTTSTARIDSVKPANYVGTFAPCKSMKSYNMLGDCYILDTEALCDYSSYKFPIVIKAVTGQDPISSDAVFAYLMDKTFYKDDNGAWQEGWCDDSAIGTSYDPGIDGAANYIKVSLGT